MATLNLNAKIRTGKTKGSRNLLRRQGGVPGVYYVKKSDPISIEALELDLKSFIYTPETYLVNLKLEGKEDATCILKDVQFDPVTDRIVHFDIMGITKGEKIFIEVPITIIGSAIGVKEGGILQHSLHKIEVKCLPSDIPEHIEVSISDLKMGHSIHVRDLKIENVEIVTSGDSVIVGVTAPRAEKVEVPAEGEETKEPEVISKGKSEDKEE